MPTLGMQQTADLKQIIFASPLLVRRPSLLALALLLGLSILALLLGFDAPLVSALGWPLVIVLPPCAGLSLLVPLLLLCLEPCAGWPGVYLLFVLNDVAGSRCLHFGFAQSPLLFLLLQGTPCSSQLPAHSGLKAYGGCKSAHAEPESQRAPDSAETQAE